MESVLKRLTVNGSNVHSIYKTNYLLLLIIEFKLDKGMNKEVKFIVTAVIR